MTWFRSHIRFAARVALFALCLQLALSFGHVHRGEFVSSAASASVANVGNGGSPASPDGTAGDICAVCALIQLVNVSVPAAPPRLPLPVAIESSRLVAATENAATISDPRIFQARAPPGA